MNGSPKASNMNAVLVIGVHREELGFGIKTAQTIDDNIQVVQISSGLSHKKSLYRSSFYHSTAHREMYLQLHQLLKGKADLVIDLHTGINETGRCADILSADPHLLGTIQSQLDSAVHHPLSSPGEERLYQIIQAEAQKSHTKTLFPACHTIIPEQIWNGTEYTYAGLEIYLYEPGDGTLADCQYAAQLIHMLCLYKGNNTNKQ